MKEIKLTKGKSALVDDEDYEYLNQFKWHTCVVRGIPKYAQGHVKSRAIYMHALIMGFKGLDHADGDGFNNQRYNLRKATDSQNACNRRRKPGKSGYTGVYKREGTAYWRARVVKDGKKYYAQFPSLEEAVAYRDKLASKLHGAFAVLNETINE